MKKPTFEEAREYARSLNLSGVKAWRNHCSLGKLPENMMKWPRLAYRHSGWTNWGDFLGTGNISLRYKKFWSFKKARKYVRGLGLTRYEQWIDYTRSGKRIEGIPSKPHRTYRNKGWLGYSDWMGNGRKPNWERDFLPFEEAREYIRSLGLKSQKEWDAYVESGEIPYNIPKAPYTTYLNDGWSGLWDWIGLYDGKRKFWSFKKSRRYVRKLRIGSYSKWRKFCESGKRPPEIPACPFNYYKEWEGWGDFLGNGRLAFFNIEYKDFDSARKYVRSLMLTSKEEWDVFARSDLRPSDIPMTPEYLYKGIGWDGYRDWLGVDEYEQV